MGGCGCGVGQPLACGSTVTDLFQFRSRVVCKNEADYQPYPYCTSRGPRTSAARLAAMADLSSKKLLDSSRALSYLISDASDLPPVSRSIHQIAEQSERMLAESSSGQTSATPSASAATHRFLASHGVDAMDLDPNGIELTRPATEQGAASSSEQRRPRNLSEELEDFLDKQEKQFIHDAIFEANQLIFDEFECDFMKNERLAWEAIKPQILRDLNFEAGSYDASAPVTAQASSPAATLSDGLGLPTAAPPRHAQGRSAVRSSRSVEFSGALSRLWSARAASGGAGGGIGVGVGTPFDLLGAWREVSASPAASLEGASTKLGNCWELCHQMALSSKPLVDAEADATPSGAARLALAMLEGAISHLGRQQHELIKAQMLDHPETAMRGGMPGTEHDAAARLNLEGYQLSGSPAADASVAVALDGGRASPLWPTVYWCLRCGDRGAAMRVMQRAANQQVASPASWKALLALITALDASASTARAAAGGDGGQLAQFIREAQLEYWANGAATNEALSVVYSVLCAPMDNVRVGGSVLASARRLSAPSPSLARPVPPLSRRALLCSGRALSPAWQQSARRPLSVCTPCYPVLPPPPIRLPFWSRSVTPAPPQPDPTSPSPCPWLPSSGQARGPDAQPSC